VGYLPRHVSRREHDMDGKFGQIIELYESHDLAFLREKSHRNYGMASYRLLQDIIPEE